MDGEPETRNTRRAYARGIRTSVRNNAGPYGYSVMIPDTDRPGRGRTR